MIRAPGPEASVKGFTLIELLTVIGIISLLAVIAVPIWRKAQTAALAVQSSNNLRQLATANLAYAAENGRFVPAADRQNLRRWHGARPSISAPFDPAKGFLADYLGNSRRVTPCPLMNRLLDKSSRSFEDGSGGFGYNSVYLGGMRDSITDKDGVYVSAPVTRITRPAQTVMFTTTAYAQADGVQEYPFCEPPYWDFGYGPVDYRPSPSVHFRVDGMALVAWCDGHVSRESPQGRDVGYNPHGGDAKKALLGWFGSDKDNGYWNPER